VGSSFRERLARFFDVNNPLEPLQKLQIGDWHDRGHAFAVTGQNNALGPYAASVTTSEKRLRARPIVYWRINLGHFRGAGAAIFFVVVEPERQASNVR
jgi:hypothetical protein